MYNAHAFFAADVLVHVGAPVREVAFRGKRYTLSFSLRPSLSRDFHPRSLPHPSTSHPPCSFFSSRLPVILFPSSLLPLDLGPSLSFPRPTLLLVLTRLIQMNRGLSDVSRRTNWILKIKKRRLKALYCRSTETRGPTNGRTVAPRGLGRSCFFSARSFRFIFTRPLC